MMLSLDEMKMMVKEASEDGLCVPGQVVFATFLQLTGQTQWY